MAEQAASTGEGLLGAGPSTGEGLLGAGPSTGEGSLIEGKDALSKKVFVRALARRTNNDVLYSHFEQFGEIKEAVVIRNIYTSKSRRYGFVTFKDAAAAQRACENTRPFIDGTRVHCILALEGVERQNHHTHNVREQGMPILGNNVLPHQAGTPTLGDHVLPHQASFPQAGFSQGSSSQDNSSKKSLPQTLFSEACSPHGHMNHGRLRIDPNPATYYHDGVPQQYLQPYSPQPCILPPYIPPPYTPPPCIPPPHFPPPHFPQLYFPYHYPQSHGLDAQEVNGGPSSPNFGTGGITEYRLFLSGPVPVPVYPLTQAIIFQTANGPVAGEITKLH